MKQQFINLQRDTILDGGSGQPTKVLTFEEKVRAMSAKEIIMAMVDSLTRPPIINVDMNSFGSVKKVRKKGMLNWFLRVEEELCFGCAATNTVCQIAGVVFTPKTIGNRPEALNSNHTFLEMFEYAIDSLRCGKLRSYNYYAKKEKFAQIKDRVLYLPKLETDYTNDQLIPYKELAELQEI